MRDVRQLKRRYEMLSALVDERTLRLCAAADALAIGRGGVTDVARAAKLSRTTIYAGVKELQGTEPSRVVRRVRRSGAGRRKLVETDAALLAELESLLEPVSRGDPQSPLRWTCKSTTKLAEELVSKGHRVSQRSVCTVLRALGYSLQANRKTREGASHPDRDEQFRYISELVKNFNARNQPAISVDAKKKELLGDFKNAGREWAPQGQPVEVNMHDFADKDLGKVVPYGVYDLFSNEGWVSVGIDHNTAQFAVESIRRWWYEMGRQAYPQATELLITADGGGSNGSRLRLWKVELQRAADELGMVILVSHFPPGTSKWNKIEHRMFCHITQNWRARPLTSREVVVNLISSTTTRQGLRIKAALDENAYQTGIKVSDAELAAVSVEKHTFHGDWNYRIRPRQGD